MSKSVCLPVRLMALRALEKAITASLHYCAVLCEDELEKEKAKARRNSGKKNGRDDAGQLSPIKVD